VRLELEGFTAFRAATVVDFDGVDLFAAYLSDVEVDASQLMSLFDTLYEEAIA
jgi:hypothetical protein